MKLYRDGVNILSKDLSQIKVLFISSAKLIGKDIIRSNNEKKIEKDSFRRMLSIESMIEIYN